MKSNSVNIPKVSVLVVEDENIVSKDIQNSLKKLEYTVAGSCARSEDAVEMAREHTPDIVLMDIMLKGEKSGLDAAEIIYKELNIPVVFLTAYADESTLEKAKLTDPYGYILKPFKEIELKSTIEMALHKHYKVNEILKERDRLFSLVDRRENTDNDVLFVKNQGRMVRVDFKDIYFIEALKDYVVINTAATRYTIHSTMKDIEKRLSAKEFIRVHRSFISRIDKIVAVENHNVILENEKKVIPIGGLYKSDLQRRLNMV